VAELVVLVPVLGRPKNVAPLLEAFARTTPSHRLLFIADRHDRAEVSAIRRVGAEYLIRTGGYASKIHAGVVETDEPLVLTAADDLVPHAGWYEAARSQMGGGIEVVGLNDLIDRSREHATHFLMTRHYAELPAIDGRRGPFSHAYGHWRVDDEFIATAKTRGAYRYCPEAVLEHRHPMNKTAPDDDTYRKGRASARQDNRIFRRRERLWTT